MSFLDRPNPFSLRPVLGPLARHRPLPLPDPEDDPDDFGGEEPGSDDLDLSGPGWEPPELDDEPDPEPGDFWPETEET